MDDVVVTAHQPNFLPGMSVMSKIRASDWVIWLDDVQYTKGGFTNRNRLPNGEWVTVPVERHCAFKPISQVRLAKKDGWRERVSQLLLDAWPGELTIKATIEICRPLGLLVGLNARLLELVMDEYCHGVNQIWQHQLDAGHAVPAISEDPEALLPISDRLAMMVAELGGDVYLSGPSGRNYLDEEPFERLGIEVAYWKHEGPNPCVLDVLSRVEAAA